MKNFLSTIIFWLCLFGGITQVSAQSCGTDTQAGTSCDRSSTFHGELVTNSGCGVWTTSGTYSPGTYFRMPVLEGGCYSVSTCDAGIDTQVSCFEATATTGPFAYNDDNGPICNTTRASVTFTPTFTDYTRVDVREYNCQPGGSQSITVKVRQNNNIVFTSSDASMCQGQTRSLTATPAAVGTSQPNSGDLGTFTGSGVSGTVFTAPTPAGASQTYTITYTFGYCSATQDITVYKNPSSAFAGNDQTVCGTTTNLAATSPAIGTGTWTVVSGPGTVTSPNSPTSAVTGLSTATPTILTWTVTNGPCSFTSDNVQINVQPQPVASFGGTISNLTVNLLDFSTATSSWMWDFGDGNSDTLQEPSHTYGAPGVYTICLIASNSCGSDTSCAVATVCDSLTADWTHTTNDLIADFTASTAGNPTSWLWDFGDGNTSTQENPTHSYASSGTYTVCLTATNACGSDSTCSSVNIICPLPSANIFHSANELNVSFFSDTAGNPTSWLWDFGDGVIDTVMNPVHNYSAPGTYVVCLTASNNCGSDITCDTVVVTCSLPAATWSSSSLELVTEFTASSTGNPTSWLWDFGDGNTSTQENPTHTYSATGTYIVCLTATNACGTDSTCGSVSVVCPLPTANIFHTSNELNVSFFSDTVGNPTSWIWDFGDGNIDTVMNPIHNYSSPGTYVVCLTASNNCGSDITCDTVVVTCSLPLATWSSSINGLTVSLNADTSGNPSSWLWDFGDGNTSTQENPTHTYGVLGTYTVCLTATNACGTDSTCGSISVAPACDNPTGQSVSNIQGTQVTVSWDPQPNAISYKLRTRIVGTSTWSNNTIVAPTAFKVKTNLVPNSDYEYQLKTVCSENSPVGYGATGYFTTGNYPCDNPTVHSVSDIQATQVTMHWNPVPNVTKYKVKVREVGTTTWSFHTIWAPDTFKVRPSLNPGTDYEYKVKTFCQYNTPLSWGAMQYFTTLSACDYPGGQTASNVMETQATISWDSVPDAISYKLRLRKVGSSTWLYNTIVAPTTMKVRTNLEPDSDYEYGLKTVCSSGTSNGYGPNSTFTTLPYPCDNPSVISTSNIQATQATILWDSQPNAIKYKVKVRKTGTSAWDFHTVWVPDTIKVKTGLDPNTDYEYKVKTVCAFNSPLSWSGFQYFTTLTSAQNFGEPSVRLASDDDQAINIYPNPTNGICNIELNEEFEQAQVSVYNGFGQLVSQSNHSSKSRIEVEIEGVPGIYLVQVAIDGQNPEKFQIIKE